MAKMVSTVLGPSLLKKIREAANSLHRDVSLPQHKVYVAATAVQRREMKISWVREHLLGQGFDEAEDLIKKSRPGSAGKCRTDDEQAAYDAARQHFRYHIMRPDKPDKAQRINRQERAAWAEFVKAVGNDRATLIAKALG